MVVDWEQETGLLMTSGDVRVIRIWDTEREMKVQVGTARGGGVTRGLLFSNGGHFWGSLCIMARVLFMS